VASVPGVSEGIRVRSIVGQYLEHSRIFHFANYGRPEWYIGSADLMERNLDRRVEAIVPVEDPEAQQRIGALIEIMSPTIVARGSSGRTAPTTGTEELTGIPGTSTHSRCSRRARRPRLPRMSSGRGGLMPGRLSRSEGLVQSGEGRPMATGRKVEIELKYEVAVSGGADRYLVAPDLAPSRRPATSAPRGSKTPTSTRPTGLSPERASPRGCAGRRAER